MGQYLGEGGMTLVGKLCPLLGGTGPATMVLVSLLNVYYCVIVGWAIFYLIVSLATLPTLPWDTCGNDVQTFSAIFDCFLDVFRRMVEHRGELPLPFTQN